MARIGFLGLGNMGLPMAANLHRAGHAVTGFDPGEKARRMASEAGAINLSQGFPDFNAEPVLFERVAHWMREGMNQYPPMAGVPALREAIAAKVADLYGARYDAEREVTVTAGATQALFTAIAALDKVVMKFRELGAQVEVIGLNEASQTMVDTLAVHDKGAMDLVSAH